MNTFIHSLSDVQSHNIGENTKIWQYCVVLPDARIGTGCNICSHCFIENDVLIGDNVTIKCGVQLWNGITLEDNVFIGSNVTFCNDRYPRSGNSHFLLERTLIKKGSVNRRECDHSSRINDRRKFNYRRRNRCDERRTCKCDFMRGQTAEENN